MPILRQYAEDQGDEELVDYLSRPADSNNPGEGSGDVFKKLNYATLQHVRRMLRKIHATYAHWPLDDRQVDMMIDSIGNETIEKLAERAMKEMQ